MRTTVTLDDDVYASAMTLSKTSGESLGKVLSSLARKGIKQGVSYERRKEFPVFMVKEDSPIIPGDRAYELLDED